MLKIAAVIFHSIALLFYQLFFADAVTVTQTIPSYAQIGTEFTVEVTIDKGANAGFAKFQQDLPAGFTATEAQSEGGSYTFSNQSVKIIWMSLPINSSFKISYKVKVSAEAKGVHDLTGKFAYVYENIKQTIDMPSATIVVSDGITAPTEVVSQTTPNVETLPSTTPLETKVADTVSNVSGIRKLPENILSNSDITVEVILQKSNLTGFAKLVETLPAGFKAEEIQSEGAVFAFEDQKVTYIWSSIPEQPEIKISYKVKIDSGIEGNKAIEGVFSFVQNDQTIKYEIPTSNFKVNALSNSMVVEDLTTKPETIIPQVKSKMYPKTSNTAKVVSASNIPSPQGDGKTHFKVQIIALRKAKSPKAIAEYFKLDEIVTIEMPLDGYTIYTVGDYADYVSAHDARDRYVSKNAVVGAFITAYNQGKRIAIQEALATTNQKWYK
jgi:hypothetical protein